MTDRSVADITTSSPSLEDVNIQAWFSTDVPFTAEEFNNYRSYITANVYNYDEFSNFFPNEVISNGGKFKNSPDKSYKAAQGWYVLGDYEKAIDWLGEIANPDAQVLFLKALCLREMKDYDGASATFEAAEHSGYDQFDISMEIVCTLRRAGKVEEAQDKLNRSSRIGEIRSEYHYQMGRLLDAQGQHQEAMIELERATKLDPDHVKANFHLAYICDLYADEDLAIEYYKNAVNNPSPSVNALLNLSVLFEEKAQHDMAYQCVKRVLAAWPNNARARMFIKDIEASRGMYFDEDRERRVDRRNKVLEIPISDFELSVRSRNCLRKMNIRTVGDLLNVTEAELLAYKNFGETSLLEIKQILSSKNLRLGQMVEDSSKPSKQELTLAENSDVDQELLDMNIDELNLSVRSRKCLDRLNIRTIGELTIKTEAELLGCKNFGMTSLNEVNEKLTEKSLTLRKLDS